MKHPKASDQTPVYSRLTLTPSSLSLPSFKMKTPTDSAAAFRLAMGDEQLFERFFVAGIGSNSKCVGIAQVAQGTYDTCTVDPRVVFTSLLLMGPVTGFLLCHNHPSGDPTPSVFDLALTRQLRQAGQHLCLRCLDHIILGEGERFVSMLTEGLMEGSAS